MAETSVENRFCPACGVDVRPGSLFCYNCGSSVAMIHAGSDKKTSGKISNVKLKEKIKNDLQTTRLDVQVNQKLPAQTEEKPIPKPVIRQEDKIKSSMSTRRKPKSFQYKTVEVSWEEPENAPNVWFIAASLLLTFFVLLIFLLAMYLK